MKECGTQEKKKRFFKVFKVAGKKCITSLMKNANDHGEFQQQSTQRLDDEYTHTSGQNDRWLMRLKLIQEEYYFIGKQTS